MQAEESEKRMSLEKFLESEQIWHRFIEKPRETVHTAEASTLTGLELDRMTKNLVSVTSGGEYVLLIVSGSKRVDLKKAAEVLGTSNVSLLAFNEAEQISGYPPGATPSVGHKTTMRVVLDSGLLNYETVYCGGGSRSRILELRTADIVSLNNAIVSSISK